MNCHPLLSEKAGGIGSSFVRYGPLLTESRFCEPSFLPCGSTDNQLIRLDPRTLLNRQTIDIYFDPDQVPDLLLFLIKVYKEVFRFE